ncbi:YcxB family protein [Rubritalea marina]|uniref:YcxB family protein n=1 Tax=Rubritalea marina TaxID=361055 RepID=UPI00036DC65C|nr:YcxB family protein [Rubritalea marina]
MSDISIHSRFDGPSQHGSFRHHLWQRHRGWVIARSLMCVTAVGVGAFLIEPGTEGGVIGSVLVVAGTLGFMRPMIWQMWQERMLRKHPAFDTSIDYTFTAQGMQMRGEAGDVDVSWADLHSVVPTKKGLLIYQDAKQYMWIPVADITPEQMEQVAAMKKR